MIDKHSPALLRVSVIIPFLNAERYLREAIDSVMVQTFSAFELILVDDGSIDASTTLARDYATTFPGMVKYVEHEGHTNRGVCISRNAGAVAASGEYVAFLDADDVWTPTKLTDQVAILDRHPEVAMVAGAAKYWGSWEGGEDHIRLSGHVHDQIVWPPDALLNVYPLAAAQAPCPSTLMIRKSTLDQVGGFEAGFTGPLQMYEDQAFLSKIYINFPVYFSKKCCLLYRLHAESCVAQSIRNKQYDSVRRYFLDWLGRYLTDNHITDPRVWRLLERIRWRHRHPLAYDTARFYRRVVRRCWAELSDKARAFRHRATNSG